MLRHPENLQRKKEQLKDRFPFLARKNSQMDELPFSTVKCYWMGVNDEAKRKHELIFYFSAQNLKIVAVYSKLLCKTLSQETCNFKGSNQFFSLLFIPLAPLLYKTLKNNI